MIPTDLAQRTECLSWHWQMGSAPTLAVVLVFLLPMPRQKEYPSTALRWKLSVNYVLDQQLADHAFKPGFLQYRRYRYLGMVWTACLGRLYDAVLS